MTVNKSILMVLAALTVFCCDVVPARATLSEPDVIYYGTAAGGSAGVAVTLRLNDATVPLLSYTLGSDNQYVLRLPMDTLGSRQAGVARTGDSVSFYVDGSFIKKEIVPERGSLVNLDLSAGLDFVSWQMEHPGDPGTGDKNRNGVTDFLEYKEGIDPAACIWTEIDATHAETTIYDQDVLANCLKDSEGDFRHNLLRLAQGTYRGNFSYNAYSGEDFDLTLLGGYPVDGTLAVPGDRSYVSDLTVLSGDTDNDQVGNGRVLLLNGEFVTAKLRVEGLHLQQGKITGTETGAGILAKTLNGQFELVNTLVSDCQAEANGGGVAISTTGSGKVYLAGNIIHGNQAALAAALSLEKFLLGDVKIVNNTFAGNTATNAGDGQSVMVTSSAATVDFINNILSGQNGSNGADLKIDSSGVPIYLTVKNNDFDAATVVSTVPDFALEASNLTLAPKYVDALQGDYRLKLSSPCIDKGKSYAQLPATDLYGDDRVLRSAVDIGADEANYSPIDPSPALINLAAVANLTNMSAYTALGEVIDNDGIDTLTVANASNATFAPATATVTADGSFSVVVDLVSGYNLLVFTATDLLGYKLEVSREITLDAVSPSVIVASTAAGETNISPIPMTVTFSEEVSGFDSSDLTITNGTVGALAGSGGNYSFTIIPAAQGPVTVNVAAGAAQDAAGNASTVAAELTRVYDTVLPSVTVASATPNSVNTAPIPVTVNFSEAVSGFTQTDLAVTNGIISDFIGSGANYSFTITPIDQGVVTANVASDAAQDGAGNASTVATELSRIYDNISPKVVLASPTLIPATSTTITVTVTFSEPINGFTSTDLAVTNSSISNFTGSGANYSFDLVPAGLGMVTVDLAAGAAYDDAGNSSESAVQLAREWYDLNGDSDGDGVPNYLDAFRNDPSEWLDNDNDGIGDNADLDDDNDGIVDQLDAFPTDPTPIPIGLSISPLDGGLPGISRVDGADDLNNLDSIRALPLNNPAYAFQVVLRDSSGAPVQDVRLQMNGYAYPMTPVLGHVASGLLYNLTLNLGPAASYNYHFEGRDAASNIIWRYPAVGGLSGPRVELLNGGNMVGVPKALSSDLVTAGNSLGSSAIYRWVSNGLVTAGASGSYVAVNPMDRIETGEGYYLKREALATLPSLGTIPDLAAASARIVLQPGWNMISNPYNGHVLLENILVQRDGESPVTWLEATDKRWLSNAIYSYQGSDWGGGYAYDYAPAAALTPWVGYWVYVNRADVDYTLIVLKPQQ